MHAGHCHAGAARPGSAGREPDGQIPQAPAAGVVCSRVFPGLRLAAPALLNGDLAAALQALQAGIDADEHRRFTARLLEP